MFNSQSKHQIVMNTGVRVRENNCLNFNESTKLL